MEASETNCSKVSNSENRPVTLDNNHSGNEDLMIEGQKEVQKPAEYCKVTKDSGDVVTLEAGEMNSLKVLVSDVPLLKQEESENNSQKEDMTRKSRKSKHKSVTRIVFGLPLMHTQHGVSKSSQVAVIPKEFEIFFQPEPVKTKLKMPPKGRKFQAATGPIPQAGAGPRPWVGVGNRPQAGAGHRPQAAAGPRPQAAAGPRPQFVSATESQPSTSSVAGTSDLVGEKILGKNGGQTAQLEAEKAVFLQETEQLKAMLEAWEKKIEKIKAAVHQEVIEKDKIYTGGSLIIEQLEAAVNREKEQKIKTEKLLAQQSDENKTLKDELAQAQKKVEQEKHQREEDMSRLLAEHSKITSMMRAAAIKAQEDLKNERSEWLQERSSIQAALRSLKESIDKNMEEKDKLIAGLTSQVNHLKKTQEDAQTKTKKRSLWKRFVQLFKRS